MVDMRMRRSNIGDVSDLKEAIIQQNTRRTGPGSRSSISTTTGPPESVKALTSGQDNRASIPSILKAGGGAVNTSPVPPPPPIVTPNPTPAFVVPPPPPPPPIEAQAGFVTPPPPPGFVPPPPPPPLTAEPEEDVSFPEPQASYSDNIPAPEGYVPPPMPSFRDPGDSSPRTPPTFPSNPPSRSSSPAIGGNNRAVPQRTTSGLRGPRTGAVARGPRTVGVPPAPGRRGSYGQARPQTPPSPSSNNSRGSRPGSTGPYNPSAHRRSGSGSSFARRTMASDAEVN